MPYSVKGTTSDGNELWLSANGNWVPDKRHAGEFRLEEGDSKVLNISLRNRGMDPEDRIEPTLVGPEE